MSRYSTDYSKWNHFGDSDSDDDEQESSNVCRVTRLEQPSTITTKSDGSIDIRSTGSSQQEKPASTTSDSEKTNKKEASTQKKSSSKSSWQDDWTLNGGQVVTTEGRSLYWSQDRYTVSFRLLLNQDSDHMSAKNIRVTTTNFVSYADRHNAVITPDKQQCTLSITHNNKALLSGTLPHACHYNQDEDSIDWAIETHTQAGRYIQLTLNKATPLLDLTIWWKRPFIEYDEVDDIPAATSNSGSFQQAWEEAHAQFKDKIARGELPRMNHTS